MNTSTLSTIPRPPWAWWKFCLLLSIIFFCRGQAVLNVYPSMEGFDEFQHTGYLIYLAETGKLPVLGETVLPKSLYPEIVANPHSDLSWRQVGEIGGRRYKDFFTETSEVVMDKDILLFQAQHPPVYYLLMYRLFDFVRQHAGYREAVYTLRSFQLLFGAAALFLLVFTVSSILPHAGLVRLAGLAISLLPMFLFYILRISNDALAVLLASIVFYMLAAIRNDERLVIKAIVIGILIAVGALTKTIAFLFLPVAIGFFVILLFYRSFSRIKVISGIFIIPLVYITICFRYHLDNLHRLGTMFPALETVINARNSHSFSDLLSTILPSDAWTFFIMRLIKENLWKSGMTFLEPWPAFEWIAFGVVVIGACGWLLVLFQKRQRDFLQQPDMVRFLLLCLMAVGSTFAGAYVHGLNCRLAWGDLITPAYYVMVAFPALLTLVFFGLTRFGSVCLMTMLLLILVIDYVATEVTSLVFIAIPYWAYTYSVPEIINHLQLLSSKWTGPSYMIVWWMFAVLGFNLANRQICRAYRISR